VLFELFMERFTTKIPNKIHWDFFLRGLKAPNFQIWTTFITRTAYFSIAITETSKHYTSTFYIYFQAQCLEVTKRK